MSGAVPPLSPYALMAWTGKLLFYLYFKWLFVCHPEANLSVQMKCVVTILAYFYVPEINQYKHYHSVSIIFSDSKIEPATPQNAKRVSNCIIVSLIGWLEVRLESRCYFVKDIYVMTQFVPRNMLPQGIFFFTVKLAARRYSASICQTIDFWLARQPLDGLLSPGWIFAQPLQTDFRDEHFSTSVAP